MSKRFSIYAFSATVLFFVFLPAQAAPPTRSVVVVGGASDTELLERLADVAARGSTDVVLIDTPRATVANRAFLAAYHPDHIHAAGAIRGELRRGETWAALPTEPTETVVVCSEESRRLLLQSSCLAGAMRARLVVARRGEDAAALQQRVAAGHPRIIVAVGKVADVGQRTTLADETAVRTAYLKHIAPRGKIDTLVVANPADQKKGGISVLAPWMAVRHKAALLLTDDDGENTSDVVRTALKDPVLARADSLLLAGGLDALPMEKRANPVFGKDPAIEMEPLTPWGDEPVSFATGRIFHEDLGMVALVFARARLLPAPGTARSALVASNPGSSLPLLETFSRHTARELKNAGYDTTSLIGGEMSPDKVRKAMAGKDVFLWEGHYRTLIDTYDFLKWDEPLPATLCFLQSCLALKPEEADVLWQRGSLAVVGSSTRTYSGTGGAFSLAYFDALLYDEQSLGGSLRSAKNYLIALALLKEKRLPDGGKLNGANVRSAWAFTLWGDPTVKFSLPPRPATALPPVRHSVQGNDIVVTVPEKSYPRVSVEKFQTVLPPNARLAGLLATVEDNEDAKSLVPLLFAEVALKTQTDKVPKLSSRLSSKNYVWLWDDRRGVGYLLVRPHDIEPGELKFRIHWEAK